MAFPANWNKVRQATGTRSIRFYQTGTATALFSDNAYVFGDQASASNFTPMPVVAPGSTATVTIPAVPSGGGTGDGVTDPAGNGQTPLPRMLWSRGIIIRTSGTGALEFSFDGVNVHGTVPATTTMIYTDRCEACISVRGVSGATPTFTIEAW